MTGIVSALSSDRGPGTIVMDNGLSVSFEATQHLGIAAVGRPVTFEVTGGDYPRAVNIQVSGVPALPTPKERIAATINFRLMGFDQQGSVRAYRFEELRTGQRASAFVIKSDLGLLAKHRIAIQDGSALCLQVLRTRLDAAPVIEAPLLEWSVQESDILAYIAARPVPGPKTKRKPKPDGDPMGSGSGYTPGA